MTTKEKAKRILILVLYFAIIFIAWQLLVTNLSIPLYIIPPPSVIVGALAAHWMQLWNNSVVTVYETLAGLLVGGGISVVTAMAIVYSRYLKRTVYPTMVGLQAIPKPAVAPLLALWFGLGLTSKIMMAAAICFFPILINSISGLSNVDSELIDLATTMRATQIQLFRKIRIPHALPYILDGLKIGVGLALIGALVAEFVSGSEGLGYLAVLASTNLDSPQLYSTMFVSTFWYGALFGSILLVERVVLRWHPRS